MNLKRRKEVAKAVEKGFLGWNPEKLYYRQNGIIVRDSINSDIRYLSQRLKQSDKDEIWASHHYTPEESLKVGFGSLYSFTIQNGNPIGMFGINPESFLGNKAIIWFLSSDELYNINIRFLKNCKKFVEMFLDKYSYLHNYVDVRNKNTIKWLKFIGAEFDDPQNYGMDNLPFMHFWFQR